MYNMESQIKIFETGTEEGIMTRNKKFYDESFSQEQINEIFYKTRQSVGVKFGFKGEKMFQANQKSNFNNVKYTDGKYVVINEKHLQSEDYWYENIPADILIISNKYKNIVVGNQMADCPVIIIEDRKLPKQIVEALEIEFNSNKEHLYAYIGSCIKKESYIYDKYPLWATNKDVWSEYIIKKDNYYHIDLVGAIIKQLTEKGIKNIEVSPYDTATNKKYYSNSAASKGKISKKGQNFVGFFYK